MIAPGTKSGPVWRIAPLGVTEVYLNKLDGERASVSGRGQRGMWTQRGTWVATADVFATRPEARAEYRRRRAMADAGCVYSRNFTTSLGSTTHAQTADE